MTAFRNAFARACRVPAAAGGAYTASAVTIPGHSGNGVEIDGPTGAANDSKVTISTLFKFTADGLAAFQVIIGGTSTAIQLRPGSSATTDIGVTIQGATGEFFRTGSDDGLLSAGQWYHAFMSADMGHADGAKVCNLWVNGADVVDPVNTSDGNPSFEIFFAGASATARSFIIPDTAGEPYDQDYSDTQIWIGQCIDPAVHIAKFWSAGKPVDPAVPTAAFGAPTYLLSGNKDAFAGSLEVNIGRIFTPGSNGAGPVSLPGATIGQTVRRVLSFTLDDITADFESTISVTDEIQQTSATDYSTHPISFVLVGALANAATHP